MKHIRILSPSGAIDSTYINNACARLRAWGYEVSVAAHACGHEGRFAGTDEQRIADWREACDDPTVDIILCARGGYGLQRIIDQLPPTKKLVVGFSDITELHLLENQHGFSSLHGLMCKHIATLEETDPVLQQWRRAIEGETLSYSLPPHPLNRIGTTSGVLVGGNLSVLYGLQATPFGLGPLLEQHPILFIEDIAERHYHIDRMINNLRMSGVLAQISGLIVGQFTDCADDAGMGESVYQTIRRYADEYHYPLLFDFPAGHVDANYPIRLGSHITLDCKEDSTNITIN